MDAHALLTGVFEETTLISLLICSDCCSGDADLKTTCCILMTGSSSWLGLISFFHVLSNQFSFLSNFRFHNIVS